MKPTTGVAVADGLRNPSERISWRVCGGTKARNLMYYFGSFPVKEANQLISAHTALINRN